MGATIVPWLCSIQLLGFIPWTDANTLIGECVHDERIEDTHGVIFQE